MKRWPDDQLIKLLSIEHPIIQAPMAGADSPDMAGAVSEAGGLGSLACALLTPAQIHTAWKAIRAKTAKPINLNFFCHKQNADSPERQERWKKRLAPFYKELQLDPDDIPPSPTRAPFDDSFCAVVEEIKPPVVSFHFGLPEEALLKRVKKTGAVILSSATTVEEAVWLEEHGCDAIIAQGSEAGGHRAMFLTADISTQVGTAVLVPQIVEALSVPVVASGGIGDAQGIRAALALGASAVQLGTAYLFCREAKISPLHLAALSSTPGDGTAITNIFSGRPARGIINRLVRTIGPMSADAPEFPYASRLINPLRAASEAAGSIDFMQMWSGQAAALGRPTDAAALTRELANKS
ncbi:MAG TPA: nitronate monooxygenase [Patescibacteria group bacterium]|nr:nitronate monooxygenase [Patescibacteria group bacterium]